MKKHAPKGRSIALPTASLVLDRRLQMRSKGEEADQVAAIMEAIKAGKKVPRVKVRVVKIGMGADPVAYVTDGFHTVKAYIGLTKKNVPCEVKHGTFTEAVIDAAGSNTEHLGLRRTADDKRRAVEALLELDEAKAWTNPRIADHCDVSKEFVRTVRGERPQPAETSEPPAARVGADGKKYKAKPASKPPAAHSEPLAKAEFDWKAMEVHLGALVRGVDQAKKVHDAMPPTEVQGAHRVLNEFTKYFNHWKKLFAKK